MKLRRSLAALFALAAACSQSPKPASVASPPDAVPPNETVRRYDFLMGAGRAGEEVVVQRGDERRAHFEFNDRGRGPKTHSPNIAYSRPIPRSISDNST